MNKVKNKKHRKLCSRQFHISFGNQFFLLTRAVYDMLHCHFLENVYFYLFVPTVKFLFFFGSIFREFRQYFTACTFVIYEHTYIYTVKYIGQGSIISCMK